MDEKEWSWEATFVTNKTQHTGKLTITQRSGAIGVRFAGNDTTILNEVIPCAQDPKLLVKNAENRFRITTQALRLEFQLSSFQDFQKFISTFEDLKQGKTPALEPHRVFNPSSATSAQHPVPPVHPFAIFPTAAVGNLKPPSPRSPLNGSASQEQTNTSSSNSSTNSNSNSNSGTTSNNNSNSNSTNNVNNNTNNNYNNNSLIDAPPSENVLQISVENPRKVSWNGETYVIYTVSTKTNVEFYRNKKKRKQQSDNYHEENGWYIWKVRHRYTEFEKLWQKMVSEDGVLMPPLPGKSYFQEFDSTFLETRAMALNNLFTQMSLLGGIFDNRNLRDFLTQDPHQNVQEGEENARKWADYFSSKYARATMEVVTAAVKNVASNPTALLSSSGGNATTTTTVNSPATTNANAPLAPNSNGNQRKPLATNKIQQTEDYETIIQTMRKHGIVPSKLPFEKFVVLVLGTTSSGKSSWVNHFFGVSIKRWSDCQQDTAFTLVETVPRAEFEKYRVGDVSRPYLNFTNEELTENVSTISDKRYGHVFIDLDTNRTLARYANQLSQFSDILASFGLVKAILVNEEYVPKNRQTSAICHKTILIDSPGFLSEKNLASEYVNKFLGNLRVLKSLYTLADQTLFFIPITQLSMISTQITVLELSMLYSSHGKEKLEKIIREAENGTDRHSEGFFTQGLITLFKQFKDRALGTVEEVNYKGTVSWEKTLFVLTKLDQAEATEETLRNAFYELGVLFASSLTYLPSPVAGSIFTISLPEKCGGKYIQNNLSSLHNKLTTLSTSSYESRVEAAIQIMCQELKKVVQQPWILNAMWNNWSVIEAIEKRSISRVKEFYQ